MGILSRITRRGILRFIGWVTAASIAAGLLVHFILFREAARPDEVLITLGIAACYVLVITSTLIATGAALEHYIPLGSRRTFFIHALVQILATLFSLALASILVHLITGYTFIYNRGTMTMIGLVGFCGTLIGNGSYYLTGFYRRMRQAEHAALRSELGALRAQINPHFLFNSLNSIAALIRSNPAEAERITESLADLFRYSLRSSRQPTVTLAEEMESVQMYLAIERARFRDRLHVITDIDESLLSARVPSLLLQPLVENAVKHGAGNIEGACTITIAAQRRDEHLLIRVSDTGPGFSTTDLDQLATRGSGLANVRERLRLLFGREAVMRIIQNGVEMIFPSLPENADGGIINERGARKPYE